MIVMEILYASISQRGDLQVMLQILPLCYDLLCLYAHTELNKFIAVLDKRADTVNKNRLRKPRILSVSSNTTAPHDSPSWAVSTEENSVSQVFILQ